MIYSDSEPVRIVPSLSEEAQRRQLERWERRTNPEGILRPGSEKHG